MTIQNTILAQIQVTDANGIGLSINQVLANTKQAHPGCKTTKACVSWYLSKARTGKFEVKLPQRRMRGTAKAKPVDTGWTAAPGMSGI